MKCPRDGIRLSRVKVDGVQLDKCSKCCGIWLDADELNEISELQLTDVESQFRAVEETPRVEFASVEKASVEDSSVKGYMRCPRCLEGRLQQVSYTLLHPVRIDRCENCLGIWLDRSELDVIIGEKQELEAEYSAHRLRSFLQSTSGPHQVH